MFFYTKIIISENKEELIKYGNLVNKKFID